MRRIRIIPVLLIKDGGLVKSVQFKKHRYVGDPINAVRIFNEKMVDELVVLDISATPEKQAPNLAAIADIASEAFMPMSYGGGITSLKQIEDILYNGVEKVVLNWTAIHQTELISQAAKQFGSQSVVVSIDAKKGWMGTYQTYTLGGKRKTNYSPVDLAQKAQDFGAGEIIINSITRDGTYQGYDLDLIARVSQSVDIPVVACGGAGELDDFKKAINYGASAVAAGSMFVFKRPHNAVLISYPSNEELTRIYESI